MNPMPIGLLLLSLFNPPSPRPAPPNPVPCCDARALVGDKYWPLPKTDLEIGIKLVFQPVQADGGTQYFLVYQAYIRKLGTKVKGDDFGIKISRPLRDMEYDSLNKLTKDGNQMPLAPEQQRSIWDDSQPPVQVLHNDKEQLQYYKRKIEDLLTKLLRR